MKLELKTAMLTEIGSREVNEDYLCYDPSGIFLLADGLGGHLNGEIASKLACEVAKEKLKDDHSLETAFNEAQRAITHNIHAGYATLCILKIYKDKACLGHIGDSRIYLFRKDKFFFRTLDHSVPQLLCTAGKIAERKIRKHPDRNRLLRVLGGEWDEDKSYEIREIELQVGDVFLLCSDGLWEQIKERQMVSSLKRSKSPQEWLERLKIRVEKKAKKEKLDNYSAIAIWIKEDETTEN